MPEENHLCPSISGVSGNVDRVNALYSPFRPKDANPESYEQKMKFWAKAVDEYVTFGNRLTFTLKELQKAFRVNNKVPACVEEVVDNLSRGGTVLSQKDYYDFLKSSTGWLSWSQVSVRRVFTKVVPMPWTYFSKSEEIRYVHVTQLKTEVEKLTKEPKLQNVVMGLSKFKDEVKAVIEISDPVDLEMLLSYLKTNRIITVDNVGHEEVILMASSIGVEPKITVVEKGKYDVFRTKEILEKQLEELNSKAQIAEDSTKRALKQGKRNTAKHELRRKKLIEQRADKLLNMVDNLTVIAMKIEDAESDATMLSAYEAGKKALAGVLEDKQLTVDRVTEAMLDIQDLLDTQADINAAISQPIESQEDTQELDDELEMLLKEDENKEKEKLAALRQKEEDEALKLLEGLKVEEDDLEISVSSPGNRDLHSSVASES